MGRAGNCQPPLLDRSSLLAAMAAGSACAAVPAALAASGALRVQVFAASAGSLMVACGAAALRAGWRGRHTSELRRLAAAFGFFLCCAGSVLLLAGVGLYH
jgi:hypothetical protein